MSYLCESCNKSYKTYMGLWKHNKNHHSKNCNQNTDNPVNQNTDNSIIKNTNNPVNQNTDNVLSVQKQQTNKVYSCAKCNKIYTSRQAKWKHEKTCNKVSEMDVLKEQVKQMNNEIQELKLKPNVINNYTTNNTQHNKKIIIHSSPGMESIAHLSVEQQRVIMNKGLQSLMYLIKTTNFNKEMPENHSYCVTALNDKHASVIDTKTNAIIKTEKTELFDKVLIGNIKKLETIAENKNFELAERQSYKQRLDDLKNILFMSKRETKVYYNELNLLSYNNRDLVYETWADLKSLDDMINSNGDTLKKSIADITITPQQKPIKKTIDEISSSESDSELSDFESDTDEDNVNDVCEVKIKNKFYIVKNGYLFDKNDDGTCGKIYGIYKNVKIQKIVPEKHIEL